LNASTEVVTFTGGMTLGLGAGVTTGAVGDKAVAVGWDLFARNREAPPRMAAAATTPTTMPTNRLLPPTSGAGGGGDDGMSKIGGMGVGHVDLPVGEEAADGWGAALAGADAADPGMVAGIQPDPAG